MPALFCTVGTGIDLNRIRSKHQLRQDHRRREPSFHLRDGGPRGIESLRFVSGGPGILEKTRSKCQIGTHEASLRATPPHPHFEVLPLGS